MFQFQVFSSWICLAKSLMAWQATTDQTAGFCKISSQGTLPAAVNVRPVRLVPQDCPKHSWHTALCEVRSAPASSKCSELSRMCSLMILMCKRSMIKRYQTRPQPHSGSAVMSRCPGFVWSFGAFGLLVAQCWSQGHPPSSPQNSYQAPPKMRVANWVIEYLQNGVV